MAKLPKAINRNELPSMTEFSALPKGNYNTIITKTGYEISDNGKESIVFTLKVIDGEYKNRCIFASLTQVQPLNPNESDPDKAQKNKDIAENIGKKLLNSLMMATDMSVFEDTDEFLNKMVEVKINLRPATEKYSERNEIVSFSCPSNKFDTKSKSMGQRTQKGRNKTRRYACPRPSSMVRMEYDTIC